MISIKSGTFKNVPKTLDFSKEIINIQSILNEHNRTSPFPQTAKGLLSTISFITKEASAQSLTYLSFNRVGLITYNDNIVLNPFLFSLFIDWDQDVLTSIILLPEFNNTSLTKSQFLALVRSHVLSGSILDWKVLSYPHEDESIEIKNSILPIGGESFSIASDYGLQITDTEPKLCLMSANIFTKKPHPTIWQTFKDIPYDEILIKFAESQKSPKKCWLLYKENNT